MYFSQHDLAIYQAYARNAFTLAPTPSAIEFAQTRQLANASAGGNGLDRREFAANFEVHAVIVAKTETVVNPPFASALTKNRDPTGIRNLPPKRDGNYCVNHPKGQYEMDGKT